MVNCTRIACRMRFLAPAAALVLGVAAFFAASPAAAQTATATLDVVAVDGSGGPLPGVTVEVKRPETGFSRTGVTGSAGLASFAALPPGTYDVTVKLAGFETVEQKGIVLLVGQSGRVSATLQGKRSETVSVVASAPLVDVYKTDSSMNILPEQIRELPVENRNFEQLAFIAPGVQRERGAFRFVTGGPVIGAGGNASQSTILVDGVDFTDPALGLAKTRFSQDAIAEFRVVNNRFDTEVGGSAGGALSIITRSGTNDFKGSLYGFYRSEGLRAKGALEQESSIDSYRGQFGFTLGGPIVKDQTHFFASVEGVTAVTPILFRPVGPTYGPLGQDFPHPVHQTLIFAGVDQRLTDSMRLSGKFDYERYREDNFRVGGVGDLTSGQDLNRDNWNLTLGHTWNVSDNINELRGQYGKRKYDEPPHSTAVADYFTSGTHLVTGGSIYGDLLGDGKQWELRDTFYLHLAGKSGTHDIKLGAGALRVDERFVFDVYGNGLFFWATDTKALPVLFIYGTGNSDVSVGTTRWSGFLQDEWKPLSNLSINVGVRYDLDTNANDPDFSHPLVPNGRDRDTNNIQPRLGFSWDVTKSGQYVVRGGAGIFTGRYLLVPIFTELQQNGATGWLIRQRLNGLLLGLPALALDPANPRTTGIALPPDITLLDKTFDAPEATQASLGATARLGNTGLYFDVEGVYVKGRKEIMQRDANWSGNATHVRPNPAYNQINTYTNDGESVYKGLTFSVNGNLKGGHLITTSVTLASKKNRNDDFSPEFPVGYPSDSADPAAEYGRARSDERFRLVMTGIFRLPWQVTVSPIFEYGSGQPWTHRYGYDFNGDGKTGDRQPGVERFGEDGPPFRQLSLRVTKGVPLPFGKVDVFVEAYNVFNTVNYDVSTIDGGEFTAGPTLANPNAVAVRNSNFGKFVNTFPGREVQFGVRLSF